MTAELESERYWRLADQAEDRAMMARVNLQDADADRLWALAERRKDQARETESRGA
jgi:hypothetical protein